MMPRIELVDPPEEVILGVLAGVHVASPYEERADKTSPGGRLCAYQVSADKQCESITGEQVLAADVWNSAQKV